MGLLPLAYPLSLPLGAFYWNCLARDDPHLSTLSQPLFPIDLTILGHLLALVGFLMKLPPFHFSGLLLCSIPSLHFSVLSLNCLAKNLAAAESTDWLFVLFAPPGFSTVLP